MNKENIKQVIIVRTDLELSIGKISTQIAHASHLSFLNCCQKNIDTFQLSNIADLWLSGYFKKIILKINSEEKLLNLYRKAIDNNLPCYLVLDNAFNELEKPTYTALGIGPALDIDIDKITKRLRIL